MDPGGIGGAFGGVKAGGQQDPLTYLKRPTVVIRICALVSLKFSDILSNTCLVAYTNMR